MEDIKKSTLLRAIAMLEAVGARYEIVDPDGVRHGKLEEEKTSKRRPLELPYGTLTAYVKPFIENMKVGDVQVIDLGSYSGLSIQSVVANWLIKRHGNGCCTTRIDRKKNALEVLRIL